MNLVDWDFAVTVGSKVAGPGPEVSAEEAAAAVLELREGAERSTPLVREFTGLHAAAATAPVLVVDRAGWLRANADGVRHDPRAHRRQAHREEGPAVGDRRGHRLPGDRRRGRG